MPRLVQAVVFRRYGPSDVLRVEDVNTPSIGRRDVLVRIHATTVTAEDPKLRAFDHPLLLRLPIALLYGYPRPRTKILGMEFSGVVEAKGPAVRRFTEGDEVFGYTGVRFGAYAQYKSLSENAILALKPRTMTHAEAAAVPNGALTALVYLRTFAKLRAGERILIHGASGSVGAAAVQLAKVFGAEVTGVCSSSNVALVSSLGADDVVDYTQTDISSLESRYDVVFDTVGKLSWSAARRLLGPKGRFLATVFGFQDLLTILWTSLRDGPRMFGGASNFKWKAADLDEMRALIDAGRWRSVIDRIHPLGEAALAHDYVERGHKRGNVVLTVA